MAVRVPIDGRSAKWARMRLSLSLEDAATQLKITAEQLGKIEDGSMLPGVGLFQKISRCYLVPEASLFAEPPETDTPLPSDFRTFDGARAKLSYETVRAIRLVQARQSMLQILSELDSLVVPPELEIISLRDDPEELGAKFRRKMGFDVVEQLTIPRDDAFRRWRTRVEGLGISVYIEPLGGDQTRGVSIYQNPFPAIIIDQNEKNLGARAFTLIHELAHILVRHTGISDLNRSNSIERFCNRFAAAFLMPPEAVRSVFSFGDGPQAPSVQELGFAAEKLCVTMSALALRLEEVGIALPGYYQKITKGFAESAHKEEKPKPAKKSKPPYKYTYLSRFGENFTGNVIASVERGAITNVEGARMLNAAPKHFGGFKEAIAARRQGRANAN